MPRRKARPQAQPQAKYDAAGNGRRIKSWSPPSTGPIRVTEGLQKIRNRARDTARNDWAGESGLQKWTSNLIGVGITPRWESQEVTKRWAGWVPAADADGVLDAYGLQTLGTRAWLDGGEVFLRRRPRSMSLGLPTPMQVQLIESDFVPLFDSDEWPGMPRGNTIRQGIERNRFGRRTAYWMYREHPGDGMLGSQPSVASLIRVPASEVSHLFEPKRPGQLRGVSMLAPVLVRLRASMDFEDAVLDRQKLANLFTMFITRQMPPDTADIDFDPLTGLPLFYDQAGKVLAGLEPGISQELLPGEDVKFANPPEAGTTYSEYMRTTHMGTAAGAGLPYEMFSGDLKDISDRTLRVAINEFRRFARQRQWQLIVPRLCQPMVEWWAEAEVLAGTLPMSVLVEAKAPTWSPHGWEYIHPTQDAEGKKIEVEAGFRSRSDVIAERGDDPRTVDDERAADLKRSKALGLEPPPPPKPAPAAKPTPAAVRHEELSLRLLAAQAARAEAPVVPAAPPIFNFEMAAPVVNVAPAAPAAVQIQVEPTPIENRVEVNPTPVETVVHVSAPTVENVVNVAPAEVVLPPRETIVRVTGRNEDGQITETRQTDVPLQ
jgi:lambda family phage portal protein